MSKSLIVSVVVVVFSLVGARAKAQTALQQLKAQAGESAAAAAAVVPVPARAAVAVADPLLIPRRGADVFAQCQVFAAKAFSEVQWTLPQAVQVTQFCLNKDYAQRSGYSVAASAGETGIVITVEGRLRSGDPVLVDLGYTLAKRGGKLLGYSARLDSRAQIAD